VVVIDRDPFSLCGATMWKLCTAVAARSLKDAEGVFSSHV
jgi:hypothetical protein